MSNVISRDDQESAGITLFQFKPIATIDVNTSKNVKHEIKLTEGVLNQGTTIGAEPTQAFTPSESDGFQPLVINTIEPDVGAISMDDLSLDEPAPLPVANNRDDLVESLLKQNDDLSSKMIKLEMQLEDAQRDQTKALDDIKSDAFEKGIKNGKNQAAQEREAAVCDGLDQLGRSIVSLDQKAQGFEKSLENIKAELLHAALDIANEVVNSEVSENSSAVATKLSEALIKELQGASKITLKVNPNDFAKLSENMSEYKNVSVSEDSGITAGGVVALSDAGNIDDELHKRFERVKQAALSE
ncbi:MAG: flagellar assembly protein FliH [Helicobacteraceae bacterium]|nr:flagellar assembly protein FliH [Helicobacteraceae bacterium]